MPFPGVAVYVPYEPAHRDAATVAPRLFAYAKALEDRDARFGRLRFRYAGPLLASLETVPATWARGLGDDQFVTRLSVEERTPYRGVRYAAGSPKMPTDITIDASADLMLDEPKVVDLLTHAIDYWGAGEATVATLWIDRTWRVWKRWLRDVDAGPLNVGMALDADGAHRETAWGGTVFTWPDHHPARIVEDLAALAPPSAGQ